MDWRSDSPTAFRTVQEITVTSLLWVANWLIAGAGRDSVRSNRLQAKRNGDVALSCKSGPRYTSPQAKSVWSDVIVWLLAQSKLTHERVFWIWI